MKELALSIDQFGKIQSPTPIFDLNNVLSTAANLFLVFAILLTLFFLISGGFDLITATGEKQKIANAKQKLTFAVIGLIVVLLSLLIVGIIGDLFGIKLFNTP